MYGRIVNPWANDTSIGFRWILQCNLFCVLCATNVTNTFAFMTTRNDVKTCTGLRDYPRTTSESKRDFASDRMWHNNRESDTQSDSIILKSEEHVTWKSFFDFFSVYETKKRLLILLSRSVKSSAVVACDDRVCASMGFRFPRQKHYADCQAFSWSS